MQKEREKFKKQFKSRIYNFILGLLKFVDCLPRDSSAQIIGKQLIRSGTSVGAKGKEMIFIFTLPFFIFSFSFFIIRPARVGSLGIDILGRC